jgi:hypothetical protein
MIAMKPGPATDPAVAVETLRDLAIRHVNIGERDRARLLCEHAARTHPPHPGFCRSCPR